VSPPVVPEEQLQLTERAPPLDLVPPPDPEADFDAILRSPLTRDPGFEKQVQRWVRFWKDAPWFSDYLKRMSWFEDAVDSVLASRGLPLSLRYLPIVESGYSPHAVSPVSAAGIWQLMEPTARGLGLRVSPLLDERRNPFKSTDAAAAFLESLHDQFGSWLLTLAAYNAGPARVERLLDRRAPLAPRTDSLYWKLRAHLPRETREFVPKFFAAVQVAEHPALYGLDPPDSTTGFSFDRVSVPDATTLDVVAKAAGVDLSEVERLNPEIIRGITPPGRKTYLRVPAGRGPIFTENYAKIPRNERVTFVEHRVRQGETLTWIARRYGIPLRDLEAANPGVKPRRLQIGQRLTVPVAPSARRRVRARAGR
jgi:membrane-bound lytic murein transglycosylase D